MNLLILVWLILGVLVVPSQAATRYVSASCTNCDSNSCTAAMQISTPRQTIAGGLACTQGGDTLIVRGGTGGNCVTYQEGGFLLPSGSSGAYTTLQAFGAGTPSAECVQIRPNSISTDYLVGFTAGNHHVIVDGFKLNAGDTKLRTDPHYFDHAAQRSGFVLDAGQGGSNNIIIRNNELTRSRHSCIFVVTGDRWELRNNEIHHCGKFCCNSGCDDSPENAGSCPSGEALHHVCGNTQETSTGDDHGIYVGFTNTIIANNYFHHNPTYNIQFRGSNDSNIIENNLFSNSRCGAIFAGSNHIIRNNVWFDDGHNQENDDESGNGCDTYSDAGTPSDFGPWLAGGSTHFINNTVYRQTIQGAQGNGEIRNTIRCEAGSITGGSFTQGTNLTGTCPAFVNPSASVHNFHLVSDDPAPVPRNVQALLDLDGVSRRTQTARGAFEFVTGGPPPPVSQPGPLVVHPTNPRYFQDFATGKAVFLTGSSVFCNLQQFTITTNYEACTQDYTAYLDFLSAHHHNYIRLWRYDLMGADLLPWPRTGPGTGFNSQPKLDLTQFDAAFFTRLRQRVVDAGARGMYVGVMLFDGTFSESIWSEHPMNPANNINGIDGGVAATQTLVNTPKLTIQENYIKHVVDTLNDLDNFIYEISNESVPASLPWQQHMVEVLQAYQATKPKQHMVGVTSLNGGTFSDLLASGTPWNWSAPGGSGGYPQYRDDPPAATGQKVLLTDTDHIGVGEANTPFTLWANVTRGHSFVIMEPSNCPLCLTDTTYEPVRFNAGQARTYLQALPLASMVPHGELSSTSYALAQPGQAYLVFQPGSGQVSVQLEAATYDMKWWNVNARTETTASPLVATTGIQTLTPPFSGPAVLVLATTTPTPPGGSQLIAHWKLDEGTGTTAADNTGHGHTGTLGGSTLPSWTTGTVGPFALTFTGSNFFDSVGSFTEASYSWAMWVKGQAAPDATCCQVVFANGIAADNTWSFGWSFDTARFRQAASHRDGSGAYITAQIPDLLSAGVWYHVAATFDGVSLKVYLNGILRATSPATSVLSPSGNFRVGAEKFGTFGFPGSLDDIRIYNYPLTQPEIAALAGTPPVVSQARPRHVVVVQ